MPQRLLIVTALIGIAGGGMFGFERGLSYLPTLPVAVVEGAIVIGLPATILGGLLSCVWWSATTLRKHFS